MGVVVATACGAAVEVGSPGVGADGVAGEVADGVAELLVGSPAEADRTELAGLASAGRDASQAGQRFWGREAGAAVADLGQQAAARTVPAPARLVKMWASAWRASCSSICSERSLICWTTVPKAARKARVTWTWAAPSAPVAPLGAAVSRACRVAGATRPQ